METAVDDHQEFKPDANTAGNQESAIGPTTEPEQLPSLVDQGCAGSARKHGEFKRKSSNFRVTLVSHTLLPPEILASIFVHTLDGAQLKFPPLLSNSPWILRRVCSRWRHIAINEPHLWNNIDVRPTMMSSWKLINHVIPHSAPMSISISCHTSLSSWGASNSLLIPQLWRIKHLNLHLEVCAFTRLFNLAPENFSSLESLTLDLWGQKNYSTEQLATVENFRRAIGFQSAVRLKKVDLSSRGGVLFSDAVLQLPLAWSQITHLNLIKLQPLQLTDLHQVMRQCFSLVELYAAFYYRGVLGAAVDTSEPLDLPYLKRVELQEYISRPHSLLDLQLPWNLLTRLHLYRLFTLTLSEACHLLSLCMQVEDLSLHISEDEISDTHWPHGTTILPNLRCLNVYVRHSQFFDFISAPMLDKLAITGQPIYLRSLSNMIKRSASSPSTFSYSASQFLDSGHMGELLVFLSSVVDFQVPNMVLGLDTIQAVAKRSLLPQITTLVCELQSSSLLPFTELLEMYIADGVTVGGAATATLRQALGNYLMESSDSPDVPRYASSRLQTLNERFGTNFAIITRMNTT